MKLQILSDLHLEFGMIDVPHTDADVVIAAGDIHVQEKAIEWLKKFKQPVIYICGNHEYWHGERYSTQQQLRQDCSGSNIHFLERDSIEIDGTVFHGCTLWTDYAQGNQWVMEEAESKINDFKYIQEDSRALTADDLYREHQASLDWLQRQLEQYEGQRQVVVSHHAPSKHSWARSASDALQFAYCNDLDNALLNCPAALWVHGHIHSQSDYTLGNTRVVCNPRGYHGLAEREDFNPRYCIELK